MASFEKYDSKEFSTDFLKQQELLNALQGFQKEENDLNNAVSNKDLATEENTMIESLNYKFSE